MKKLLSFFVLMSLLAQPAFAEYCWMVGCKGKEGYIVTEVMKNGKRKCVFVDEELPAVGSDAVLADFVNMSESPSDKPEEGPYKLGVGFVVRVLGYVGKDKRMAHIKIISDSITTDGQ